MALDQSFVGRSFPLGEPYVVGIEKIREFATAIGDDNPISHDTAAALAAGHDGLVASPTFAIAAVARAQDAVVFDPALGLDFSRVVHGDQRFVHHRPIVAGDELNCVVTVDAIRALGSNDVLTLRAELTLADGTPVTTRGLLAGGQGHRMIAFEDLTIGDAIPAADYPITRDRLVRYAGASGDFNPIHWNPRVADEVGLPDVIAHGMLTMATASRSVTDWVGDPARVIEYSVRFTRTVAVPDDGVGATVEVTGVVGSLDPDARTARIDLTVKAAGVTVLGKARALVQL